LSAARKLERRLSNDEMARVIELIGDTDRRPAG
jgi:hypothetical protein